MTSARAGGSRPAPSTGVLDDPGWFGAVMGTGAVVTVLSMGPGLSGEPVAGPLRSVAVALYALCALALATLVVRLLVGEGSLPTHRSRMRSPVTGAAYATIPGAVNVMAVAAVHLWPDLTGSPAGWWVIAATATAGTLLGLWLTIEFFVSAFEHPDLDARHITGVWFIPETVVLLGALLFSGLARDGPAATAPGLSVLAFALLGTGALLFALTATLFVNRLVLHPHDATRAVATVWIMISPLSVTSLALLSVAQDAALLGGRWTDAVLEMAAVLAAMLWGFSLWWVVAAAVLTSHAGRAALTGTAADWGYVFPSAAMVIGTLTLARWWNSSMVEWLGAALGLLLVVVWATVTLSSLRAITGYRWSSPEANGP